MRLPGDLRRCLMCKMLDSESWVPQERMSWERSMNMQTGSHHDNKERKQIRWGKSVQVNSAGFEKLEIFFPAENIQKRKWVTNFWESTHSVQLSSKDFSKRRKKPLYLVLKNKRGKHLLRLNVIEVRKGLNGNERNRGGSRNTQAACEGHYSLRGHWVPECAVTRTVTRRLVSNDSRIAHVYWSGHLQSFCHLCQSE